MFNFVLRRLGATLFLLLLLYTIVFFLIRSAPGWPWDSTKPIPASVRDNLLKFYHLDEPVWKQFTTYLWNLIAHGDMGPTYRQPNRTVNDVLAHSLSISAQLGLAAMVLAILLGIGFGVISSLNRRSLIDNIISLASSISLSVPEYVTIPILVLILALTLHLVPTAGWDTIFSAKAVVPILGLAIRPAASIAQYTRSSMLDVLGANYIVTAKAKGLSRWMVVLKHALPNALIPIVTVVGTYTAFIVTGSFYVETAYGIPGLGRLFVQSIGDRDYPVVMGITLLVGTIIAILNLSVDILYTFLDPKVRHK